MTLQKLPTKISKLVDYSLARATRIHPLPSSPDKRVWIKREDELSSGISGSKLRKYASLLPALRALSTEHVAIIGGPNSNNLVGLAQLLRENGIPQTAFIREAADTTKRGNSLFLDMLLNEEEKIVVPRANWSSVDQLAQAYLDQKAIPPAKAKILKEGCFNSEALPGSLTLAEDILRNEFEHSIRFDRIYIDSGTGLSAIGLILGLSIMTESPSPDREIVITLIAGNEASFEKRLSCMQKKLSSALGFVVKTHPNIRLIIPTISPKFGSVNKTLFENARSISKTEGLIMDPTYSVKHYVSMQRDLQNYPHCDSALFVFNGSALGACGFQDGLALG